MLPTMMSMSKAIGWVPEKTIQDAIFDTIDYLKKEIEFKQRYL